LITSKHFSGIGLTGSRASRPSCWLPIKQQNADNR
jgi:hypothetical protein